MNQLQKRDPRELLDPVLRAAVADLAVEAKRAVEGTVSGLHHSHVRGRNVEFSEHRPYNPGDELRYVDWRVYARTNRFHIKLFEEDTNLRAWLWLDGSGSMAGGAGRANKFEYSIRLMAAISELILRQGDAVGIGFLGEHETVTVPPRNRREHLHAILSTLIQLRPSGSIRLADRLNELPDYVGRRGIVMILSDLADNPQHVLQRLDLLRRRQHEVIVFQILTSDELDFPFRQAARFRDLESDAVLEISPRPIRTSYMNQLHQFLEAYRLGCAERMLEYDVIRTDHPLEIWLRQFLLRRMGRTVLRAAT